MIKQLSTRYARRIAQFFLAVFYLSIVLPGRVNGGSLSRNPAFQNNHSIGQGNARPNRFRNPGIAVPGLKQQERKLPNTPKRQQSKEKNDIGGPSQPEM